MQDKEFTNRELKEYIIDLKEHIEDYIPVGGDITDIKLAEYINGQPDKQKLKLLFARLSAGEYEFGTTRTTIRY